MNEARRLMLFDSVKLFDHTPLLDSVITKKIEEESVRTVLSVEYGITNINGVKYLDARI